MSTAPGAANDGWFGSHGRARSAGCALACLLAITPVISQEPEAPPRESLAEAFGAAPDLREVRLSPEGDLISFVSDHPDGYPYVSVFDLRSGETTVVLTGRPNDYRIRWCDWANAERILCSLRTVMLRPGGIESPRTRLVGVNADGSDSLVLFGGSALGLWQYQDHIVNWLPDDPEHVLLEMRTLLVRANVHTGAARLMEEGDVDVVEWITDANGTGRLRASVTPNHRIWYGRDSEDDAWWRLHRTVLKDLDDKFAPIAIDGRTNELLLFDSHEGRRAVFAMDLDDESKRRLVYAHPALEVADVHRFGRDDRIVAAVTRETRRPTQHFFDAELRRVHELLQAEFPGMAISLIDTDDAGRLFVVLVNSDDDAGTYYVFDSETPELIRIARPFPALSERKLAATNPVSFTASDAAEVQAYLTLPPDGEARAGVILPQGGPHGIDYARFDFLAKFLAAAGYAVLQTRYRGSTGFNEAWSGEAAFRDWARAVDDVADGARFLRETGITDPARLCVVGWGIGGYVALLSAIEHGPLYRCVVSIAGATDPSMLARRQFRFVSGRRNVTVIGTDGDLRDEGSPLKRAEEIALPTLLFHGLDDITVPAEHSVALRDAMRDAGADVELIEYENTEHDIASARYRADMLSRIGAFLATRLDAGIPDFYSNRLDAAMPFEIIDFGIDVEEPNGRCSDFRFTGADGGPLRDIEDRIRESHDDASDCRRLFVNGDIVLRDRFAPSYAGNVAPADRVTLFIDPAQQDAVALVSVDGVAEDAKAGSPVAFARPGYRVIGVRATGLEYRCNVEIAEPLLNAAEPRYVPRPVDADLDTSGVSIPAFAGHAYRIEADVIDGTLMLRVHDATEDRSIVDQREIARASCE